MLLRQVAILIYQARVLQGLTQKEVARRSGLSNAFISTLEGGRDNATFAAVERIAQALDLHLKVSTESPSLSDEDQALVDQLIELLPSLDPKLRSTLEVLLATWSSQPAPPDAAKCQEIVKSQ